MPKKEIPKGVVSLSRLKQTPRDKSGEQSRLQKSLEEASSVDMFATMYERHSTGVWQVVAVAAMIAAVVATIN